MTYDDMDRNPWVARHVEDEMAYCHGSKASRWRQARARVAAEYAGCPDPMTCECGGTAWFRGTVGVRMCPDCRAMYRGNGDRVGR